MIWNTHNLDHRIARYDAWRRRAPVVRPLIGILWEPDVPPLPEFTARIGNDKEVLPEHIRPDEYMPHVEHWFQQASHLNQDGLQRFIPDHISQWLDNHIQPDGYHALSSAHY